MLDLVKMALRISTDAYDTELTNLIAAAFLDLSITDINQYDAETADELVKTAVCTYCKLNFGTPDDYDRLAKAYDIQKAQLSMASNYTTW